MAVTQNTYTGNGSTVLYSFTFPYLDESDIQVEVNGTPTTAYILANATTVQFNSAPANGAAIRIYRGTSDASLRSEFFPGSAIRAQDLNNNFLQALYVSQETINFAASTDASSVLATANLALSNSQSAVTTANTASATANGIAGTANSALSVANSAVSTANSAVSTANSALSVSNSAVSTANNALNNSSTAISTANSALAAATALNPAGMVIYVARNTAPTGFLKANGALISRSTYADLFAAIGTTFGVGDGSTTFALPDLRGEFPRGWDDSRGIDSGRGFGSVQGQDYQSHTHGVTDPGHRHQQVYQRNQIDKAIVGNVGDNGQFGDVLSFGSMQFSATGISIQNSGASETRPRNIALLAIIKF
jgi:microcystin-dependent protein